LLWRDRDEPLSEVVKVVGSKNVNVAPGSWENWGLGKFCLGCDGSCGWQNGKEVCMHTCAGECIQHRPTEWFLWMVAMSVCWCHIIVEMWPLEDERQPHTFLWNVLGIDNCFKIKGVLKNNLKWFYLQKSNNDKVFRD
jgi:hypothetical protein